MNQLAVINQVHELNDNAWQEWKEFRQQELRKRIGPMAERKQQKLLMQYPPAIQQTMIDQSIMNSWQGLFPPKQRPAPQVSTRRTHIIDDLTDTSWAQ